MIRTTKGLVENQSEIVKGRLKRVKTQLSIEQELFTKSGRPIVFGRTAVLPQEITFQDKTVNEHGNVSPIDYEEEITSILPDVYNHFITSLEIDKKRMQQYYNRNLRFYDYAKGQRVWLKTKHYKSGENRELAFRRNGPWTIVRKLPNRVNFE